MKIKVITKLPNSEQSYKEPVICPRLIIIARYERGNQNPYIEEENTTKWPKEKVQRTNNDLKKHTNRTKDRITRTPLKTGDELRCFGRVGSSCSISGTRLRVNLVTNPVISHE